MTIVQSFTGNDGRIAALEREGYTQKFACTYNDNMPKDLEWPKHATGWERRRALKNWCVKNGVADYRIHVDTSYQHDLHGPRVYELWTKQKANP